MNMEHVVRINGIVRVIKSVKRIGVQRVLITELWCGAVYSKFGAVLPSCDIAPVTRVRKELAISGL